MGLPPMRKWLFMFPFLWFCAAAAPTPNVGPEQADFFEKKIRPLLVENCFKCHSSTSEKLKGALKLDSREAAVSGGDSGKPAIVPGEPEKSLLIEAVRYGNADLQMPPKKQLSAQQVEDLATWIRMGAPYPSSAALAGAPT